MQLPLQVSIPIAETLIRFGGTYLVGKEARLVDAGQSGEDVVSPETVEAEGALLRAVLRAPWYKDPFTPCWYLTEEQQAETARHPSRYAVHGPFSVAALSPANYRAIEFTVLADAVRSHAAQPTVTSSAYTPDPQASSTLLEAYLYRLSRGTSHTFQLLPSLSDPEDSAWEAYFSPLFPTQHALDLFESWITYDPGSKAVHLTVIAAD